MLRRCPAFLWILGGFSTHPRHVSWIRGVLQVLVRRRGRRSIYTHKDLDALLRPKAVISEALHPYLAIALAGSDSSNATNRDAGVGVVDVVGFHLG
ncbi:hypothetical protein F4824DRAFT_445243 [Ustulina deusta]|nr:hypothetical protein F4824DRAFT_445243 [Ustulina deusta]